ncbi:hypothetical protein ACLBR5_04880 [Escherichia coli]
MQPVKKVDVFCLCAQQRRKRGGAALLPVIAQTVYLIFNHVQGDASASGKGGHPRDAGRSSRKLPRHVAWGEVAKANQARRASVLKRTLSPVSVAWRSTHNQGSVQYLPGAGVDPAG